MKKRKKLTLILSLAILLSGGSISIINRPHEYDSSYLTLISDVDQEKGIKVKRLSSETDAAAQYGKYVFKYNVEPAIYTDSIGVKLSYSDGQDVPSSVIKVDHDVYQSQVTCYCLAVFTKQITLSLYALANPDINGSIHLDFRERLTVTLPQSLTFVENQVPKITPTVTSSGGSVIVDKTVKNVSYTWNQEFLDWVKQKGKAYIDLYQQYNSWSITFTNTVFDHYLKLNNSDCMALFMNKFNPSSFLCTTGCVYKYGYAYSDDDDPTPVEETNSFTLNLAKRNELLSEFDGTHPIIDYQCYVDNKAYAKSYGINLSAINISKIHIEGIDHVF